MTIDEAKEAIKSYGPGKFEGEGWLTLYLYHQTLNSGEDTTIYDGDTPVSVFFPTLDEKLAWELLQGDYAVCLCEDSYGFVHSESMTKKEYDEFVAYCKTTTQSED